MSLCFARGTEAAFHSPEERGRNLGRYARQSARDTLDKEAGDEEAGDVAGEEADGQHIGPVASLNTPDVRDKADRFVERAGMIGRDALRCVIPVRGALR